MNIEGTVILTETKSTKTTCWFSQLKMQSCFRLQAKGADARFPSELRCGVRVLGWGHPIPSSPGGSKSSIGSHSNAGPSGNMVFMNQPQCLRILRNEQLWSWKCNGAALSASIYPEECWLILKDKVYYSLLFCQMWELRSKWMYHLVAESLLWGVGGRLLSTWG